MLRVDPWVVKIPWRRKWQPVCLPGESHGQRSLVGYRLQDHRVRHDWSNLGPTHTVLKKHHHKNLPLQYCQGELIL